MENNYESRFDSAARAVCDRLRNYLFLLPTDMKEQAQEIRFRVNQPVSICCTGGVYFLNRNGRPSCRPEPDGMRATREDIDETFRGICSYSVYSHQNEIKNGFITLSGGHRVGLCGTAVISNGSIGSLRDISSINIRIARQVYGCASAVLQAVGKNLREGVLIAGAPASGKTTILRDMARQLSSGLCGDVRKVAVVDERGELAGTYRGVPQNDLGPCCDVLDGYPKGEGILQAVRSLSPEFIICDELGGLADVEAAAQGLNAGVGMISSVHAGNVRELLRRQQAVSLLHTGAFGYVVLLEGSREPGRVAEVYKAGELLAQGSGNSVADRGRDHSGICTVA